MHVLAHAPMEGLHFGGREAAVPVGIGRLECRHAAGSHALMLGIEFGTAQMTVLVRIQSLEALLVKTLGRLAMLGLVVMILMAMTILMGAMPMGALSAVG